MRFSLDVIRARKGDCLILHHGPDDAPRLVLIDGGPSGVYGPHLRPRIEAIKAARGLGPRQPLPIDLLMVSHVDDDHIQGILDLTSELIEAEMSPDPPLVRILGLWHNSFENVIGTDPGELTASFEQRFGAASMEGELPADAILDAIDDELDEEAVVSNLKVLSSIKQGARLRADADRLQIAPNPEFDGEPIVARGAAEPIDMGGGLSFTVLGPAVPELKALHEEHQAWLKELEAKGQTPADALAAYDDRSVTNLSSLVVLAEVDGRRMLLTGDARGDKILEGLERAGLVAAGGTIHVDLLKVPHHGSSNNVEGDFFRRITADHYVFSGDGEHGNPDRESLQMLLDARGDAEYTVHLTYPVEEIDPERQKEWERRQAREKKRREKNPKVEVRPDWSAQDHSIAALLDSHPQFARKIRIVEEGKPHLIDL